ncbi:hypothetical protein RHA1_ro10450 (plasmid) [Rhodococcus jostii RHA1]|uniref:Uncharacterized protein n=1 Tax=Rhodococcus jostii (strain RHA1) TaxID=101510 RepID=Q0RVP7_RHOJR|nr:hypothetical protein [Rhodococcus jostii]ABH00639.1 hypothetical protein RHA1_ro10450 [Rhodococcus jostii RHA1]
MTNAIEPQMTRLVVASDVLDEHMDLTKRQEVWARAGVVPTLATISRLLADLDLSVITNSWGRVEEAWTGTVPRPLRADLRKHLRRGHLILCPTALMQCIKEVIEFGDPAGEVALPSLDFARCVLSINQDNDQSIGPSTDWHDIENAFTLNYIAQQSFNHPDTFETLAAEVDQTWRQPWPTTTGRRLIRDMGHGPADLFKDVIGVELDDFLSVGWAIWNLVSNDKLISFHPDLQLRSMGATPEMVEIFLERCTLTLDELQDQLSEERNSGDGTPWTRYKLQMYPFMRLPDGSVLLLRLQYFVRRFFGQLPFVDVNEILKKDEGRSTRFRGAMNHVFEQRVGETLHRIGGFTGTGGGGGVISEDEMMRAFQIRKGETESVCDWAYVRDDTCVLIDANNRHLLQCFAEGSGTIEDFHTEVRTKFSEKKFLQLTSTIRQFRDRGWDANGVRVDERTTFVPLVLAPEDGMPCNGFIERLMLTYAQPLVAEFDGSALPPTIITRRDLRILEGLAYHRGENIAVLLREWRAHCNDDPFPCSLREFLEAKKLDAPMAEFEHKLGFDFYEAMREHTADLTIRQMHPSQRAAAQEMLDAARRRLPTEHLRR